MAGSIRSYRARELRFRKDIHRGVGVAWGVFAICGGKRARKLIPAWALIASHCGSYLVVIWGVAVLGCFRCEHKTAAGRTGPWIGGHAPDSTRRRTKKPRRMTARQTPAFPALG